jgi:hypothetical protein
MLNRFDKASEKSAMSSVAEASVLVRAVAEPRPVGDSVKAAISRAAARLGFAYGRTREIWYRNARRIEAAEMDRLRHRADQLATQNAINNLASLHSRLSQSDEAFHREALVHIERALRGMGVDVGPHKLTS